LLLRGASTCGELDGPIWVKEIEDGEWEDAVEIFFYAIYRELQGR